MCHKYKKNLSLFFRKIKFLKFYFSIAIPFIFIFIFRIHTPEDTASSHHFKNTPPLPEIMEEIDLKWPGDYAHSKPNYIKMLKPCGYTKKNHLIVGNYTRMHLFNKYIKMKVTAIKKKALPLAKKINSTPSHSGYLKKYSMVTAIFVHQSPVVKTYKFSNAATGRITALNVTPEHPFYVRELKQFIAVKKIKPWMSLVANNGTAHIVSGNKSYNKYDLKKATTVYNIETRRHHVYHVGSQKILVHNCNVKPESSWMDKEAHAEEITNFKTAILQAAQHQLVDELTTQAGYDENKMSGAIWRYNSLVNQRKNLYIYKTNESSSTGNTNFRVLPHKSANGLIEVISHNELNPLQVKSSNKSRLYRLLNTSLRKQGIKNIGGKNKFYSLFGGKNKFYPSFKMYIFNNRSSTISEAVATSGATIIYDQALPIHTQALKRRISGLLFGK